MGELSMSMFASREDFYAAIRAAALEEAAKAVEGEKVDYAATGAAEDLAYNTALEHAAAAIRALIVTL
jgi:hypothetical protein